MHKRIFLSLFVPFLKPELIKLKLKHFRVILIFAIPSLKFFFSNRFYFVLIKMQNNKNSKSPKLNNKDNINGQGFSQRKMLRGQVV